MGKQYMQQNIHITHSTAGGFEPTTILLTGNNAKHCTKLAHVKIIIIQYYFNLLEIRLYTLEVFVHCIVHRPVGFVGELQGGQEWFSDDMGQHKE